MYSSTKGPQRTWNYPYTVSIDDIDRRPTDAIIIVLPDQLSKTWYIYL